MLDDYTLNFILITNSCSEDIDDIHQLFLSIKSRPESDCIKLFNIIESQYDGPINYDDKDFLFFLSKTQLEKQQQADPYKVLMHNHYLFL